MMHPYSRLFLWLPITALSALATVDSADKYRLADPGYHYEFPRDYFNHPEFRTEWWYYTGNLTSPDGRHFGFELTFFRHGVAQDDESRVARESSSRQVPTERAGSTA